jgi:hypothetical protein
MMSNRKASICALARQGRLQQKMSQDNAMAGCRQGSCLVHQISL